MSLKNNFLKSLLTIYTSATALRIQQKGKQKQKQKNPLLTPIKMQINRKIL